MGVSTSGTGSTNNYASHFLPMQTSAASGTGDGPSAQAGFGLHSYPFYGGAAQGGASGGVRTLTTELLGAQIAAQQRQQQQQQQAGGSSAAGTAGGPLPSPTLAGSTGAGTGPGSLAAVSSRAQQLGGGGADHRSLSEDLVHSGGMGMGASLGMGGAGTSGFPAPTAAAWSFGNNPVNTQAASASSGSYPGSNLLQQDDSNTGASDASAAAAGLASASSASSGGASTGNSSGPSGLIGPPSASRTIGSTSSERRERLGSVNAMLMLAQGGTATGTTLAGVPETEDAAASALARAVSTGMDQDVPILMPGAQATGKAT